MKMMLPVRFFVASAAFTSLAFSHAVCLADDGALIAAGTQHYQVDGIAITSNAPLFDASSSAVVEGAGTSAALVEETPAHSEYARAMVRRDAFRGPASERSKGLQSGSAGGYVELASGLSYLDDSGVWRKSSIDPEFLSDGSVAYRKLPEVRTFAPGSGQRIVVQSQRRGGPIAKSALGGLSYYDLTSGKSALIAWVTNVPVQVHAEGVFYEHAFIGVDADIVYKIHTWGMEQDVVVYGGLPDPASFGMDPQQTRLCALTELVDFELGEAGVTRDGQARPVDPAVAPLEIFVSKAGVWSRLHNWQPSYAYPDEGALALGGAAADGERHPVAMRVFQVGNRVFLSEEVPLRQVTASLPALVAMREQPNSVSQIVTISDIQPLAIPPERAPGLMASGAPHERGHETSYVPRGPARYVFDYVDLSGTVADDITFGQGQTYYISGQLTLSGSKLTVESGTFVKFAPSAKIYLQSGARVVCRSDALNPALFTYVGDTNSAGEKIGTNAHINGRFTCALEITSSTNLLQGLSIRYATLGVKLNSSGQQTLRDVQFSQVTRAVECWGSAATASLENILITTVTQGVLAASARADLREVTFSGVTNWAICTSGSVSTLTVKDSLFATISGSAFASNTALSSATFSGNGKYLATNGWLGSSPVSLSASPFTNSTLGSFYLIQTTAVINAGTTNADAVGLFHYVTAVDGTMESTSRVDVGFHYPSDEDTDGDGLADFLEDRSGNGLYESNSIDISNYDDEDTDDDGICDGDEYSVYGTDPKSNDTDGDGATDSQEVINGSDPLSASSYLTSIAGTLTYGGGQTGTFRVVAAAEPGLLVYYSFDSNSASMVTDLSGHGYTATNYNGVQWVSNGYLNGAYHYDGTNDWIGGVNLGLVPTGSVSMWVKADAVDQWRHPFSTEYASWDDNIHFNMGPPAWFEASGLGISSSITMASNFTSGVWYHAVLTWTRTNFQAYYNGVWTGRRGHSGVYPPGLNLNVPSLSIGNSYSTAATRYWRGCLDEFKLYKKELTAAEVSNLYSLGVASTVAYTASFANAGSYVITNAPTLRKYSVVAYLDADSDGTTDVTEASGSYSNNPIWVSGYTTNIDVTISNPSTDTDGDGLPDWWEILYGLNPTSHVPSTGEGWWRFDESSGTNAANSAGADYGGGLVNMATNAWVTGQIGNALQFDGNNDYVRVPQSPAIITGQQFTASGWVWLDNSAGDSFPSVIADMTNCFNYAGFWLGVENPFFWEIAVGTCSGNAFPSTPYQTNAWVYLALTYSGTSALVYVDGVLKTSATTTYAPAKMSEIRIGWADDPAYSYHWKGMLDDVRLYKTALTSNEVYSMYEILEDVDDDGLNYLQEYALGTSPVLSDTDGDGLPDAVDAEPTVADTTLPVFTITYPTNGMVIP